MTALNLVPPPPPPEEDEEPKPPRKPARWEDLLIAPAGRYKALRKIADGGTAEIFLGEHVGSAGFRRLVALKRMHASLASQPQHQRMLLEEASIATGLSHGNLVEVRDVGEVNGRHFLVLELVDGWSFAKLLERSRAAKIPVPPRVAVHVAAEICRGLAHAHDRGVIHCDVCSHNILVSETGAVKLTDFGIAQLPTRPKTDGLVAGKPAYMSPEQASGEPLDVRTDIFSLGTVLYSALTGVLPFKGGTDEELMARVACGEFASPMKHQPSLPKELGQLLIQAMQRERWARYQTAHDFLAALELVERSSGRSELERWLAQLYEADHQQPPTRESGTPIVPLKVVRTPMTKKSPTRKPRRVFVVALAAACLAFCADRVWEWKGSASAATAAPLAAYAAQAVRRAPPAVEVVAPVSYSPPPLVASPPPPPPVPAPAPVSVPSPAAVEVVESEPLVSESAPMVRVSGRVEGTVDQDRVMVLLDTDPEGADVIVDSRVLGATPVTLRFRAGIPFEVTFMRAGYAPLTRWMTVVRPRGAPPRVSFEPPKPKSIN